MAGGRPKHQKADCRADTRGGPWAGIPKVLIDSMAYRHLSVHARAVLVELVARMNGYNNGQIGMSQREMVDTLRCSPRAVVTAILELFEHGIVDVTAEGTWKTRQARQYRLTFVSTKSAPATNEYLRWNPPPEKFGATAVVAEGGKSASYAVAGVRNAATAVVAVADANPQKTVDPEIQSATYAVALINKPYPVPETARGGGAFADIPPSVVPGTQHCERCGGLMAAGSRGVPKRFCSETCRKAAERARSRARQTHLHDQAHGHARGTETVEIGWWANDRMAQAAIWAAAIQHACSMEQAA